MEHTSDSDRLRAAPPRVLEYRQDQGFSLLRIVQIGCGIYPPAYPIVTRVKQEERESAHLTPTNAKVKKTWI
jgi:hypothetical protein